MEKIGERGEMTGLIKRLADRKLYFYGSFKQC
jgi:hypothetical protein